MKTLYIYTSSTCPHCHSAKKRLDSEGIKYIERNTSQDNTARLELQSMGFTGVPAFKLDNDTFVGLDMERIKKWVDYTFILCPSCKKKMRIPKNKNKLDITCPVCQHHFKIRKKQ